MLLRSGRHQVPLGGGRTDLTGELLDTWGPSPNPVQTLRVPCVSWGLTSAVSALVPPPGACRSVRPPIRHVLTARSGVGLVGQTTRALRARGGWSPELDWPVLPPLSWTAPAGPAGLGLPEGSQHLLVVSSLSSPLVLEQNLLWPPDDEQSGHWPHGEGFAQLVRTLVSPPCARRERQGSWRLARDGGQLGRL